MRWVGLVHCNQTVNIRMKVCQEQSQITTLCYVEFVSLFGEEPGHSAESSLNQVGSRKSNEKQLDVFPLGWVAFWNRCLHPKSLVRGFELWFQILVILGCCGLVGDCINPYFKYSTEYCLHFFFDAPGVAMYVCCPRQMLINILLRQPE